MTHDYIYIIYACSDLFYSVKASLSHICHANMQIIMRAYLQPTQTQ